MHLNWVNVAELALHAIHHQVLLSSESVFVQYVCNSDRVMGQYNFTLDNTKPPYGKH